MDINSVELKIFLFGNPFSFFKYWLKRHLCLTFVTLLTDRTNGRAYATALRMSSLSSSVVCLWRYVLWLNGASYSTSYY